MSGLIIDTDILIDVGRGDSVSVKHLQEAEKRAKLAISVITQMELMAGCRNKAEMKAVNHFLTRFTIIKLNESITDIAVELLQQYRLSHGLLIPDALIAATAINEREPFLTKNQRDFRYMAELDLLSYP